MDSWPTNLFSLTRSFYRAIQQVEALENSQSKTLSEVSELRNQHNLSKRKLERLESDLADVRTTS